MSPSVSPKPRVGETDEAYASVTRKFPPLSMVVQPAFAFRTCVNFVASWLRSRTLATTAAGLPAVLATIAVLAIVASTRSKLHTPKFVANYRQAYQRATQADDLRGQEIALNTLLRLQPEEKQNRYALGLLRIQQDRVSNGLSMMRSLADEQYGPARLWLSHWLISQQHPNQLQEAIQQLKEIIRADPGNINAISMLGNAYLNLQQPSLAEPFLKQAAETDPLQKMRYATCLIQLGRIEQARLTAGQAENELRRIVSDDTSDSHARVQWADCLRVLGRQDEAWSVLRQGLALEDDDPVLRKAFGNLIAISAGQERRRGSKDDARYAKRLEQALSYDTKNTNVIWQLAQLPLKPGQIDADLINDTHEFLVGLVEENPSQANVVMLLAWAQRMQGDNDKAIETMEGLVSENPELRLSLAELYRLTGQTELAMREARAAFDYFDEKCKQKPTRPVDYVKLAAAAEFLGEFRQAIDIVDAAHLETANPQLAAQAIRFRLAYFEQLENSDAADRQLQLRLVTEILARDAENSSVMTYLASLARQQDEVGKAAKEILYEQLTSNSTNTFQIHASLGALAQEDDDLTVAAQHFEQAINIRPNDAVICNNLAFVLANIDDGDLDRALKLANAALANLPNHPKVLETRGEIYFKSGQFSNALTDLEKCLGKAGDKARVHHYLSQAYHELGNPKLGAIHEGLAKKEEANVNKQTD